MTYSPLPAGDTSSAILAIRNLSVEVAGAGNRVVRNLSLDARRRDRLRGWRIRLASRSPRWPSWACLPQGILKIGAGSIRVEGEDGPPPRRAACASCAPPAWPWCSRNP